MNALERYDKFRNHTRFHFHLFQWILFFFCLRSVATLMDELIMLFLSDGSIYKIEDDY
jgi:hypothetical protein